MGEYLTSISFALDRLLVGDGGHPFDVEQLAAASLKVKDALLYDFPCDGGNTARLG
jgi:hypothetical protein